MKTKAQVIVKNPLTEEKKNPLNQGHAARVVEPGIESGCYDLRSRGLPVPHTSLV